MNMYTMRLSRNICPLQTDVVYGSTEFLRWFAAVFFVSGILHNGIKNQKRVPLKYDLEPPSLVLYISGP